ncbi:MAG: hypothetical protein H7062_12750 [Candidatus Saccharimonas sp.]|nr:hypothetical protein [Planctomycetaceae bacterium]
MTINLHADRKGFAIALIAGSDEFAKGVWQVKCLATGEATTVNEADLMNSIRSMMNLPTAG